MYLCIYLFVCISARLRMYLCVYHFVYRLSVHLTLFDLSSYLFFIYLSIYLSRLVTYIYRENYFYIYPAGDYRYPEDETSAIEGFRDMVLDTESSQVSGVLRLCQGLCLQAAQVICNPLEPRPKCSGFLFDLKI